MIKSSVEQLAEPIGFDIGHSSDDVQANFINGFSRALAMCQPHQLDMQICYIVDKLSPESKKVILKLTEFINTK